MTDLGASPVQPLTTMKLALRLLALLLLLLAPACSPGPVGYVNMRRVFAESETGKAATADIQRATAGAKKAAEDAAAEAEKGGPLSEAAIAGKRQRAAQLANEYQTAMQREDERASAGVVVKVRATVARVAGDRRVAMVLSLGDEPLHAAGGLDLTADVIKRLDKAKDEAPVADGFDPVKLRAENARLRAELARQGKP